MDPIPPIKVYSRDIFHLLQLQATKEHVCMEKQSALL